MQDKEDKLGLRENIQENLAQSNPPPLPINPFNPSGDVHDTPSDDPVDDMATIVDEFNSLLLKRVSKDDPINLVDGESGKTQLTIEKHHPLFRIVKLLNALPDDSRLTSLISSEIVEKIYADFKIAIEQKNALVIKDSNQFKQLRSALVFISNAINEMKLADNMDDFFVHIAELHLSIIELCKKNVVVNDKFTSPIGILFESHTITANNLLADAHLVVKNFQPAEAYSRKSLNLLDHFKKFYQQDISRRYIETKILLSQSYIGLGCFDVAGELLEEMSRLLTAKKQPDNYEQLLSMFIQLAETLLNAYEHNHVRALKIFQLIEITLSDLGRKNLKPSEVINKVKAKQGIIKENHRKTQQEYLVSLKKVISFPAIKALIRKIQHDFNKNQLVFFLKNSEDLFHVQAAFYKEGIATQRHSSAAGIVVDLCECSCEKFPDIFEKARLTIQKQKEENEKSRLTQQRWSEQPPLSLPSSAGNSSLTFFPGEKKSEVDTSKSPPPLSHKPPKRKNAGSKAVSSHESEVNTFFQKPVKKVIEYHWSCAGLSYQFDPNDKDSVKTSNKGKVKMLRHDATPNKPIWFGYIPDWVKQEIHYDPGFEAALEGGNLSEDHIRDIKKELKHKKVLGSGKFPYKFKIVLGGRDYRLYGWIDEIITDDQGQKHYLICFAHLGKHKATTLPDPETIKRKMDSMNSNSSTASSSSDTTSTASSTSITLTLGSDESS